VRRGGPYQWHADCRPASLREACAASLRRLRLERIELYQLHTVDPQVPLEESVGALAELQAEGKVGQIGVCNVSLEQLSRARSVASIVSVQNSYSLGDRAWDDVLALCEREQLVFIPWMPLARGALAGRRSRLGRIAAAHGARPAQVALAWLLQRSAVMLPIPGTSSVAHLEENLGAGELRLKRGGNGDSRALSPVRARNLPPAAPTHAAPARRSDTCFDPLPPRQG